MAYNKTLGDLITEIRSRGEVPGQESTGFVTNVELRSWINGSLAELYDLMVRVNKDFYVSSNAISVSSGTAEYALPADFYRVVGVDVEGGDGKTYNMQRFNFAERNQLQDSGVDRTRATYRIYDSNFHIVPEPNWSGNVTLWYIPAPKQFVTANNSEDSNSYDFVSGWEEYVVLDSLIKFAAKEESDASLYAAQKGALRQRIISMATDIDDNEPDRVRDVWTELTGSYFPSYWNP